MTKTGSRLHLQLWVLCLAVLGSAPGQAQTSGQLFIQGSEVNLRDQPATSANVVTKVAIGTECTHVEDAPKQWVRLKCGDTEGFTLKSLIGAEKPTVEALLARAQDTSQPAKVRLDAAMRAATLDSTHEPARKLLVDLFFDVNFEQLQKDAKKGGLHERFTVTRQDREDSSKQPAETRKETGEEGLLRELERIEYDWHRFQLRGNDFVSVMDRDGALVVYTGYFESMGGLYAIKEHELEFRAVIESRSSSAVSDVLKLALQQGARTASPDARKYSAIEGEYPGMPALSAEALRFFRALPSRWYLLRKEPDARYVMLSCGRISGAELRVDLHRRASIAWSEMLGPSEEPPQVLRVTDVAKLATGYRLRLRDSSGYQEELTLTWPTAVPNVSRWVSEPRGRTDGDYAVEHARNITIRDFGCQTGWRRAEPGSTSASRGVSAPAARRPSTHAFP